MTGITRTNDAGKTEEREPRFKLVRFDELKPRSEPAYLIKGLIPRRGLTVIWGPPKCGKRFWVFDALMHVALGWEYRGRKVTPGTVVYCAFEGGEGYGARAEGFRRHKLSEDAERPPLYLIAARIHLVADHSELIAAIRTQINPIDPPPIAVALDTLNRSIGGSESDDKDMSAYIDAADAIRRAFGCAVIIVHHCGVDERRPRGHTSLTGAVDAQLVVKRDASANIIVEVEWMKDGPDGETVFSRLEPLEVGTDSDGGPVRSCVIVPVEGPAVKSAAKSGAKPPKAALIALRALEEAVNECGEQSQACNQVPPDIKVTTTDKWRKFAYRRGISAGEDRAKQKAFKAASAYLIAEGKVAVWEDYVWPAR